MPDPFPDLELSEDNIWEGEDLFASWKVPTFLTNEGVTSGKARVFVSPPGGLDSERPPTAEQGAAYRHLKANEAAITTAIIGAMLDYARDGAGGYRGPWGTELAPESLKALVELNTVHVSSVQKDGVAFVGFEIECDWDGEHGVGVLTHESRVVEVGSADVSFTEWIAESHGGTEIE